MASERIGPGRRVIVAARDDATATSVAAEMARVGATVLGVFTDSRTALGAIGAARPDIALVDALMADPAALRLAATLRQSGVEIVYFTGDGEGDWPDRSGRPATFRTLLRRLAGH